MAPVLTDAATGLQTAVWTPVLNTRTPGDEVLVCETPDGVMIRSSLTDPGLAIAYEDLARVADLVLGDRF